MRTINLTGSALLQFRDFPLQDCNILAQLAH